MCAGLCVLYLRHLFSSSRSLVWLFLFFHGAVGGEGFGWSYLSHRKALVVLSIWRVGGLVLQGGSSKGVWSSCWYIPPFLLLGIIEGIPDPHTGTSPPEHRTVPNSRTSNLQILSAPGSSRDGSKKKRATGNTPFAGSCLAWKLRRNTTTPPSIHSLPTEKRNGNPETGVSLPAPKRHLPPAVPQLHDDGSCPVYHNPGSEYMYTPFRRRSLLSSSHCSHSLLLLPSPTSNPSRTPP
ncbi:hypothetical protein QBC39DRAFT_357494 [Podospora conica]|nr:hypothetical protein QBC39DRAFT_357494 [Schizothecium conicum]